MFSIKVIFVEYLSSRETKAPVVSQLRGTARQDGAPPQFLPSVRERLAAICMFGRRQGLTKWPPCDCSLRFGQGRIRYQSKSTHMVKWSSKFQLHLPQSCRT